MFRAIVGHRRLIPLLARAVSRDSLPPSLLYAGPAGVGKRRTAMAVAMSLNCVSPLVRGAKGVRDEDLGPLERDACGRCAACKRIGRGVHPDVIVVEPGDTGTIKIEVIRDVVDRAGYRPFEGRRRVIVIDEADAMLPPAQSALLKTLEEPPASSVFILVSSMPDALLPTVVSRCPRLRFGALTPAEVATVLVRDHQYDEADAQAAASDADGSVRRALAAQSTDIADARRAAEQVLGRAAASGDPARRLDAVKELVTGGPASQGERDRLAVHLRAMASLLRDLGLLAVGADSSLLANADVKPQLAALSRSYDARRSASAYAAVDEALAALERNASPKIVANWLALHL